MNNNISFSSLIKPIGNATFYDITTNMPKSSYVSYPWTLKESVLSSDVFTKSVIDCSVYIISDGKNTKMLHISPKSNDAKNFERIEESILNDIDLKSNDVKAFVVGAKPPYVMGKDSYELFDKFVEFSDKHSIPTTILKGGMGERDIAYSTSNDTLYISSTEPFCRKNEYLLTPLSILGNWFNTVKINPKDRVVI